MSHFLENDSNEKSSGLDQSQDRDPNPPNKVDDNLDRWIDNFLVETVELEDKEGRGESFNSKLAFEEDVSAWADRILSGGSSDEEKRDKSQSHRSDGESDDVGNTHDGDSDITPIKSNDDDDDNDDQAKENESNSDNCGNTNQLTLSPIDPHSGSAFPLSMSSDEEEVGEDEDEEKFPEFVPFEPFDNEDSGSEIAVNDQDGEDGNDEDTQHGHDPDATHPLIINDDHDDAEDATHDEPEENILKSTPVLKFENEEDSSGTEVASSESDGESGDDRDTRNKLGPGTTPSPLNHRKRSATMITIISDDDEAEKHEPKLESMEPGSVKPGDKDNVPPRMRVINDETDNESDNNQDTQNEPTTMIPPPPSDRKRSSTSITIDDDETIEENEPREKSPESKPVEPVDNEDDFSGMGLADNTSDWEEIDLNSENEEHGSNGSASTGGEASDDSETAGALHGSSSTDPIMPGGNVSRDRTYVSYYKAYFDCLYVLKITPYNGDGSNPCGILNFVLFAVTVLVASLHSVMSIKDVVFYKEEDDILLHFIKIGYDLNILLYRLYIVYLETFKASELRKVIKAAEDFGAQISMLELVLPIGSTLLMSILLGFSFPLASIIASMPGKWDFEDVTLAASEDFAQTLLAWNRETFRNDSQYIWEVYGTDITNTVVMMATIYFVFAIIGFIHLFLMKDYAIVSALTMHKLCKEHIRDLDSLGKSPPTPEACEQLWKRYKLLRAFSDQLNDSQGFLFQLFHLDNVLFSAYLVFLQFSSGGSFILAALQFCLLAKLIIFYLLAANAASVNDKLDNWAHTSFPGQNTLIVENGEIMTTSNLLHQIEKHPIGIGRGMFFIDGTFLWKFISVVGSVLIFFTEKR